MNFDTQVDIPVFFYIKWIFTKSPTSTLSPVMNAHAFPQPATPYNGFNPAQPRQNRTRVLARCQGALVAVRVPLVNPPLPRTSQRAFRVLWVEPSAALWLLWLLCCRAFKLLGLLQLIQLATRMTKISKSGLLQADSILKALYHAIRRNEFLMS